MCRQCSDPHFKLLYTPIEAALRWCGLQAFETQICQANWLYPEQLLKLFPRWPCLATHVGMILDAVQHQELRSHPQALFTGIDANLGPRSLRIRHGELKAWMSLYHPDQKPPFLFAYAADAQSYIDRYFARFSGVKQYMEDTRQQAKARGYVETVFGRRLWLPEINSPNGPRRQGAERAAINAPMQGTAADLIKLAMIAVQGWLETDGLQTKMIMQVHDELVLEVPEAELELVKRKLPELMAGVAALKVPLTAEVGVGKNWDEAH